MGNRRSERLRQLTERSFDLIVVGGGITGAAITHRASQEGLSVALLERRDYGAGTTSASSKMLHGGLRYLEQGHISLVREALRERGKLVRRLGPRRARTVRFLLPLRGNLGQRLRLRIGTWVYERLSGQLSLGPRKTLSTAEVLAEVPLLNPEGLKGGVLYHEGIIDDTFLVLDTVSEAVTLGAVALNHVEVTGLLTENGRASGVRFRDGLTGTSREVRAKGVINTSGVWSGSWPGSDRVPKLRPSKGVHIVLPGKRLPLSTAVVMEAPSKRWVFALPYGRLTLVGTTDTEFSGNPDAVRPEPEDIRYLLATVEREFPSAAIQAHDIIDSYAGLRPLLAGGAESTSDLSREDTVHCDASGLVTSVGGKLTTHAAMAERALSDWRAAVALPQGRIVKVSPATPYSGRPWPGGDWLTDIPAGEGRGIFIHQVVEDALGLLDPVTFEDVIERRIHPLNRLSPEFPATLSAIMADARSGLGLSPDQAETQLSDYLNHLKWLENGVTLCREQEDPA